MQVTAPFCILCGSRCNDPMECRVTDAREVQSILRSRCQPTAFHYKSVLALEPQSRYPICMPCVNWTRRAKRVMSPLRCKYFTPLDSVLLHALAPGRFPEPDQRCFLRLAAAAADADNGFNSVLPDRVKQILSKLSGLDERSAASALLKEWWAKNDSTSFFRHADTARAVRHTLVFPDASQQGVRRRWRR